jgi:hypothetical protein
MLGFAAFVTSGFPFSSGNDSDEDQAVVAICAATRHLLPPRILSPSLAHHPNTSVRAPDAPNHLALPEIPTRMGRKLLQLLTLQRK